MPRIRNYNQKINRKNSKGNPLDFSDAEKQEIKDEIVKLIKEIIKGQK